MGIHWTELQSALNTAAKTMGKGPRFLVVPDQRNTTMYRIYYGDKRQTVDVSEAEQLLSVPSQLMDFMKDFLG